MAIWRHQHRISVAGGEKGSVAARQRNENSWRIGIMA